jgi:hypothetical protein
MMEEFINNDWDLHQVYDADFLSTKFNWSGKIARYYAQQFVDCGVLCRIVIDGRIYYSKRDWFIILKKYSSLNDVKIS